MLLLGRLLLSRAAQPLGVRTVAAVPSARTCMLLARPPGLPLIAPTRICRRPVLQRMQHQAAPSQAPVLPMASPWRRRLVVTAVALSTGTAAVVAAQYFMFELEDLKRLVGLGREDLTPAEKRELEQLGKVSAAVESITPSNFVHPYRKRSWLWQTAFATYRAFFLIATFLPVCAQSQ